LGAIGGLFINLSQFIALAIDFQLQFGYRFRLFSKGCPSLCYFLFQADLKLLFPEFTLFTFKSLQLFNGSLERRFIAALLFFQYLKDILSWDYFLLLLVLQLHDVPVDEVVQLIVESFDQTSDLIVFPRQSVHVALFKHAPVVAWAGLLRQTAILVRSVVLLLFYLRAGVVGRPRCRL
jgi:hypothetical protein